MSSPKDFSRLVHLVSPQKVACPVAAPLRQGDPARLLSASCYVSSFVDKQHFLGLPMGKLTNVGITQLQSGPTEPNSVAAASTVTSFRLGTMGRVTTANERAGRCRIIQPSSSLQVGIHTK